MLRFIGDMIIGWVIYTESGKKMANKLVGKTIKHITNNVMKSPQFKEIASLKDIFIKDEDDTVSNNRTENRRDS